MMHENDSNELSLIYQTETISVINRSNANVRGDATGQLNQWTRD